MRPLNSLKWADLGGWLQSTGLPKQNALSLLLDPGRSMGTKAGPILGPNIVTNGDFHDFTMENDANVKGHWIFDSTYDVAEGGIGYIGQNWSAGTPTLGSEKVVNGTFDSSSNWSTARAALIADEGVGIVTNTDEILNGYISQSFTTAVGETYLFRGQYIGSQSEATGLSKVLVGTYAADSSLGLWEAADHETDQDILIVFTATSTTTHVAFYNSVGGSVHVWDSITVKEVSAGNVLRPSSVMNYSDQMTGSNPAYKDGDALAFDGVQDYMYFLGANATDFKPGTGVFTIEAWIKPYSNPPGTQVFLSKGTATGYGYELFATTSKVYFRVSDGAGSFKDSYASVNIYDDQWHHFAGVRTDTTIQLYIDGVAVGGATSFLDTIDINSDGDFCIGCRGDKSFFTYGEFAEVRYSDTARTVTDIAASYGAAKGWTLGTITPPNMVHNVDFAQKLQDDSATAVTQISLLGIPFETGVYKMEMEASGNDINVYVNDTVTQTYMFNEDDVDENNLTKVSGYVRVEETDAGYIILKVGSSSTTLKHGTFDNITLKKVLNADLTYRLAEDFSDKGYRLGPNLVTNGDFHDFTIDNDANTVGHWIFDSIYAAGTGLEYVGLDWATRTPTLGSNAVTNGGGSGTTDWVDSNEDGLADIWGDYQDTQYAIVTGNGFTGNAQRAWRDDGAYTMITKSGIPGMVLGGACKISFKYRASGPMRVAHLNGSGIKDFPANTDDAIYAEHYFLINSAAATYNDDIYFFMYNAPDEWLEIDEVEVRVYNDANHLEASDGFDITDQLTGSNPAYQNGNAVKFDGVNDYFSIQGPYAGDFNPGTGDFTVEGWIITGNDVTNASSICGKRGSGWSDGWDIYISGGFLNARVVKETGGNQEIKASQAISANTAYYFGAVYDRDGNLSLYLNGGTPATADISSFSTVNLTNSRDFVIGRLDISTWFFSGHIAEIRYSDKALTADEIKASYGTPKGWLYTDYTNSICNDNFTVKFTDVENTAYLYQNIDREAGDVYKVVHRLSTTAGDEGLVTAVYDQNEQMLPYDALPAGDSERIAYHKSIDTSAQLRLYTGSQADTFWMKGVEYRKVINGNHGVFKNEMETLQPAHPAAYKFDGVNDYIEYGVIDPGLNDFWVSLWFTASTGDATEMLVASCGDGADDSGLNMFLYSSNLLYSKLHAGTGNSAARVTGITRDGGWHHYSFGRIGGKDARFLDNVSLAAGTDYGDWDIGMGRAFRLGATNYGPDAAYYYSGQMGIVTYHIFNGATGPAAIEGFNRKLYNETRKRMIKRGLIV